MMSFTKDEDWIIGKNSSLFIISKDTLENLGPDLNAAYETRLGSSVRDTFVPEEPLPVPEPLLMIIGGIAVGGALAAVYVHRKTHT